MGLLCAVSSISTYGYRYRSWSFRYEDRPISVYSNSFARCRLIATSFSGITRNKGGNAVRVQRTHANAGNPVDMIVWVGLRINRVDLIVIRNEDSADSAVAIARFQVVAFQVEDFQTMISAIRYPKAVLRIDLESMGSTKLSVSRT
jgi:hypothetical protein